MTEEILLEIAKIGGPVGIALIVLYFVVRNFLRNQKDSQSEFMNFIGKQEESFKDTIDNHLKEQTKANNELASAIKQLFDYLKFQNHNRNK